MRESRHLRRLPDLPDRDRPGGDPARRHRDDRGDPRAQAPPPGHADHAGPVQHLVRPQPGRPRGAELGVPARVRRGRPDSAIVHASKILPISRIPDEQRQVALDLVYDRRARRATTRCQAAGALRGRRRGRRPRRPAPRSWPRCRWRSGCSGASSTASATASRPTSTRRWRAARPGDRQRRAAGRHEDGRRPVRLRPDAAAVRAAVRRGDEGRGRLPRTAHGEAGRAGKGTIVLATVKGDVHDIGKNLVDIILTNNGYTSSTSASSSRSPRSSRPPSEHERRRDRHVRPAGQVHRGDEGEPGGDERARHRRR